MISDSCGWHCQGTVVFQCPPDDPLVVKAKAHILSESHQEHLKGNGVNFYSNVHNVRRFSELFASSAQDVTKLATEADAAVIHLLVAYMAVGNQSAGTTFLDAL